MHFCKTRNSKLANSYDEGGVVQHLSPSDSKSSFDWKTEKKEIYSYFFGDIPILDEEIIQSHFAFEIMSRAMCEVIVGNGSLQLFFEGVSSSFKVRNMIIGTPYSLTW